MEGVEDVEVVSEVMVLSIWYPVGEVWKILMVIGGYALSAVVAVGHTSISETKLHMGGVQTERLRMRAQETIKCIETVL